MPKYDLSIVIPARNEMFLRRTIEDALANIESNTEIIAVLDGYWPDPPIQDNPKVHIIHFSEAIGQRAATNAAVNLSRSKYIMKVDAHCAFDKGFDRKMLEVMQDDWIMAPVMRNLHAFDWVCPNGHRRYQGPSGPCTECGEPTSMDIKWIGKNNPQSTSYCFDAEPHFQYFNEFKKRPAGKGPITESMSLQGSCFMVTKEKYLEYNLSDEEFGSWGSQGIEIACKFWLSGGKVMINHNTWYAHMFRTQGGDFGFPWPCSGKQVSSAKKHAKDLFFNNKWEKQIHPLSWLVEKFWPVPGWTQEDLDKIKGVGLPMTEDSVEEAPSEFSAPLVSIRNKKGIVYYTDNRCSSTILRAVQNQILKSFDPSDVMSVSLKPIEFGTNISFPTLQRGVLTMFKQILAGVEDSKCDIVFLAEHDVLYHPSHYVFEPPKKDTFYYDENRWFVDAKTGHALFYHACSTSMLCAYKDLLVEHYRARVKRVEEEGFTLKLGYEPGNHPYPRGVDNHTRETYFAEFPSLDLRHDKNLTPSRWKQDQFRNKSNLYAWQESDSIPGWGTVRGHIKNIVESIALNKA